MGVLASVALMSAAPLQSHAEPRAIVRGDIPDALLPLLEAAVEQVREPPSSAFEARRRAAGVSESIIAVLRSEGYYGYSIDVDVDDGPPLRGVVRVATGPQFRIDRLNVDFEGTRVATEANRVTLTRMEQTLASNPDLQPGQPGRAQTVLAGEAAGLALLRNSGFADAVPLPRRVVVDHATATVQPTLVYDPGLLVTLGGLEISGQTRTLPRWLRLLPDWQAGDTFNPGHLQTLQRRLLETGAYSGVTVSLSDQTPTDGEGSSRTVLVQLTDKPQSLIETEISYSTSEGFGGNLTYSRFNVFGRGDTSSFGLRLAEIEKSLSAQLRLPHWQRAEQPAILSLEAFQDDTEAFRETGVGASLDVTRRYSEFSFVSLGARANINRGREPSFLNPREGIERDYVALAGRAAFALDRTDNRLNPTHGYRLDGVLEPTVLFGDAELGFARLQLQATGYQSLTPRLVLAGRANSAALLNGSIPEVPSARRLYVGGGGSVRGYEFQGIGPRYADENRTPVGGLSLFEVSAEVRYRLENSRFGFVGFLDAGSLSSTQTPDFSDIRTGAGLGVRYFLDFAPIRFDLAVPLDSRRGGSDIQVYIGVGQGF
jgi:translocation and assembly module TamA